MARARSLDQPLALQLVSGAGLALWVLVAAFPLFWITAMSFKLPLDAFSSNPLQVILGPSTRQAAGGVSAIGIAAAVLSLVLAYWAGRRLGRVAVRLG